MRGRFWPVPKPHHSNLLREHQPTQHDRPQSSGRRLPATWAPIAQLCRCHTNAVPFSYTLRMPSLGFAQAPSSRNEFPCIRRSFLRAGSTWSLNFGRIVTFDMSSCEKCQRTSFRLPSLYRPDLLHAYCIPWDATTSRRLQAPAELSCPCC